MEEGVAVRGNKYTSSNKCEVLMEEEEGEEEGGGGGGRGFMRGEKAKVEEKFAVRGGGGRPRLPSNAMLS